MANENSNKNWTRNELEIIKDAISRKLSAKETRKLLGNTRTISSVNYKLWESKQDIPPMRNTKDMQDTNIHKRTSPQTFNGVMSTIEDTIYNYLETLIDTLEKERENNAKLKDENARLQELVNNRSFSSIADKLMRNFIRN